MKRIVIKKKYIYMLFLLVICLLGFVIVPTFAKFTSNYTTDDDIVGLAFDFDVGISGIEEYEEISLSSGKAMKFNVEITNSSSSTAYYGVWYKAISPEELSDDITIARLEGTDTTTSGSIDNGASKTVTVVVINNSSDDLKINIGVASSTTSTEDIEYLGGRKLISGTAEDPFTNEPLSPVLASTHIQNLYNDGSFINTVNIGGNTANPEVSLNVTKGIMLDNNGDYRYYGANPANYVVYNNELWRIIGVFSVKSSENDTEEEMRVKIIKADYLVDDGLAIAFPFDGSGVNDWSKSDLMAALNNIYYNSSSGTLYGEVNRDFTNSGLNEEARRLAGVAVYHLGGPSFSGTDIYADDWYTAERGTTVYNCSTDDGACPRATTWAGKVGIMYPSDYLYAANLSLCNVTVDNYTNDTDCLNTNWLLESGDQVTITPHVAAPYISYYINGSGLISSRPAANVVYGVKPVVYLKSNVRIKSGDGSSDNPYILDKPVTFAEDYKDAMDDLDSNGYLEYVNIGGLSSKPQLGLVDDLGFMKVYNGDYRFFGTSYNSANYVSFNNELWRIIGVFNVKSSEDDLSGDLRVKIIKQSPLVDDNDNSSFAYDSSDSTINSGNGVNDWTQADLMQTLNMLYFNSQTGNCVVGNASDTCNFTTSGLSEEARNLVDDALYYLGGINNDGYADDFYLAERGTTVWGSTSGQTCSDGACPRATTWTGKVGLMYPSDYMYAGDPRDCTIISSEYPSLDCNPTNWLESDVGGGYRWFITPLAMSPDSSFMLDSGAISTNIVSYSGINAVFTHPVVYLKPEITSSGSGTYDDPYEFSLID